MPRDPHDLLREALAAVIATGECVWTALDDALADLDRAPQPGTFPRSPAPVASADTRGPYGPNWYPVTA